MRTLMTIGLLALWAGFSRADEVLLRIDGIQNNADADVITKALANIESVKIATKPTKEKPETRIALDLAKADVGQLARAVAEAKTPSRDKAAPSATLVLGYARLDASALADEVYLPPRVEPALAKLAGVEAKKCSFDFKKQLLLVKLDDKGGAKLADILKGCGIPVKTP
jgi:hypothetical protein